VPLHVYTLPKMRLYAYRVPPVDNDVYVIADAGGDAIVIDPSFAERDILRTLTANKLRAREILNTHGHFDHTFADGPVKAATNATLAIHRLDAQRLDQNVWEGSAFFSLPHPPARAERLLEEGDESRLSDIRLVTLHTPGHTEGSVCFYIAQEKALFSGDTLFNAGLGRTDLPGGDARALVASLHRLLELPDDTVVYPGHGPRTTIGAERGWIEPLTAESLLA
jgi:glyoxylase-like metal-dependent hydrolase (beta-lactamase superfamily II)